MAAKESYQWRSLKEMGLSEGHLLSVIIRGEVPDHLQDSDLEAPTYGTVIELYHFANEFASSLHRRPNRILKSLMDTLFPNFSISRADRLERRVKSLCTNLESMTKEELDEYLDRRWIPQPTGTFCCIHNFVHSLSFCKLASKGSPKVASSPGHCQVLSHSRGEKSGEGLGLLLRHGQEMVDSVSTNPCSPPFPVRDVAMIPGLLPIFLRGCEKKSGSGLGTRLALKP